MTASVTAVSPKLAARQAPWLMALLLVLAIVALHSLQLRDGHDWADDYAMYVAHGLNLLEGRPYADTGFVPNPWAVPGPPTYPPVYPVLIMPLLAAFGPDLQMLKLFGVLMFGLALLMAHALWWPRLGRGPALVLVALLGLSPFFIAFRDEVRPDTLFMALFLLTLWLGDRWTGTAAAWSPQQLRRGLVLGLVAYLAYGTRSLGIVLLPALWLVALWRLRRPDPALLVASLLFGLLVALQSFALHTDSGYAGNLTLAPQTLAFNARHYLGALSVLWLNPLPDPWGRGLRGVLLIASLALAAVGWMHCVRRGPSVLEVVPWLYFAPLVVYWVGNMIQQRYVLPLWPLLLYHAWVGARLVRERIGARLAPAAVAIGVALVLTSYGSAYALASRTPIHPGTVDADAMQVYAWLRNHASPDAVILSGRARSVALYSHRRAVSPFGYRDSTALWHLIDQQRITYLMLGLGAVASDMDYEHPDDLGEFVATDRQRLELVLQTNTLSLYRVTGSSSP